MKYLITESRINNLIEKYILERFPMVNGVSFTKKKVQLAGEPNSRGENIIDRNVINLTWDWEEMEWSPNKTIKSITNDVNDMFELNIGKYGSDWDITYKSEVQ
jgi:hypothetical protein